MRKIFYIKGFLYCTIGLAQSTSVSIKTDSSSALIGSHIPLTIEVKAPQPAPSIRFPEWKDTIKKNIEIIQIDSTDTIANEQNHIFLSKRYTIAIFDTGYVVIPPLPVTIADSTYQTSPLLIKILTIPVDTTQAFKDIHPPVLIQYTLIDWLKDNLYYILMFLLLLIGGIIAFHKIKKHKKKIANDLPVPSLSPYEQAIQQLKDIEKQALWQKGKIKEYFSAVTDVVREFLEKQYQLPAMELPSSEIIDAATLRQLPPEIITLLKQIFSIADMVKYAKAIPLPHDCQKIYADALLFIEKHKPLTEETTYALKTEEK